MQLAALPLNGDGRRPSELAPEAYRLLEAFQWEWVRVYEHGDNESLGEWDAAGWLEPTSTPRSPSTNGATVDDGKRPRRSQPRCRRGFIAGRSPSTGRKRSSSTLREASTLALYELDHRNWQLAKQVESEVAPGGQARVICLGAFGGNDYPRLPDTGARTIVSAVDHLGRYQEMRLGGYGGCLRSFPDLPFRPGRMWPSWCKTCGAAKSNAKQKAITEKKRRIREGPRTLGQEGGRAPADGEKR